MMAQTHFVGLSEDVVIIYWLNFLERILWNPIELYSYNSKLHLLPLDFDMTLFGNRTAGGSRCITIWMCHKKEARIAF